MPCRNVAGSVPLYDQAIKLMDPVTYRLYVSDSTLCTREGDVAPAGSSTMYRGKKREGVPDIDINVHAATDAADLEAPEPPGDGVDGIERCPGRDLTGLELAQIRMLMWQYG